MSRMSEKEKSIIREYVGKQPPLPFPLREVETNDGINVMMYDIPDDKVKAVLDQLYFLEPIPDFEDMILDLHENKKFKFKESKIIREDGYNFIVSPYYPISGGTILDFAEDDDIIDEDLVIMTKGVKGRKDTVMTDNLTSREIVHSNLPFGNN